MNDKLDVMFQGQLGLQINSFKNNPLQMDTEEAIAFIHWNVTALVDELHEMLAEIGWKPWASSKHINPAAGKEMIDAWHFFMNIMLALAPYLDPEVQDMQQLTQWFHDKYFEKQAVNAARQEQGYDGVSTKCQSCKRELSEANEGALCGWQAGCPFDINQVGEY